MNIFIFLLGILLGAGAVWVMAKRRIKELELGLKRTEKEIDEERTLLRSCELRIGKEESIIAGLAEFNRRLREIKENKKQGILKELEKRGPPSSAQGGLRRASKIKTNEVADLLDISRATAFRYLEELEQEGKIEQIGVTGRRVEYKLKIE